MDLNEFSNWLQNSENFYESICKKPTTRIEACQFLARIKELKTEVESKSLPDFEDFDESEDERIEELMLKYNDLNSNLTENYAKAETLCVCWNKLDADFSELTSALSNGGASKLTVDRLESSIKALKEMFAERTSLLATLNSPSAPAAAEEDY